MNMMNFFRKMTALLIITTLIISCFSVSVYANDMSVKATQAEIKTEYTGETEEESDNSDDEYTDILLIGNSLIYYNEMNTKIFPKLCETAGKKVRVSTITESGTTLYRIASEKTSIGKQVLAALSQNKYDYVVIQPSRRVTPFEYSVYHAEKQAALKLNSVINGIGARTVLLAEPGINTCKIPVYTMNESGISSASNYYLPIDRTTHSKFVENLCVDFAQDMENVMIVNIGEATEILLRYFPDINSLYRDDNRHPSTRGSYLQAVCIYTAIFNESAVGINYVYSLYNHNAISMQRAAESAILGTSENILKTEQNDIKVTASLESNSVCSLSWKNPQSAVCYEIYCKIKGDSYKIIGKTDGECKFTDDSLSGGKEYYYKVKPYYKTGDIVYSFGCSLEDSVKTLEKPSKPAVTLVNRKTAKITITAVHDAEKYKIYRKRADEQSYKLIAYTAKTKYTDATLKDGHSYTYRVTAVKKKGVVESAKSSGKTVFALRAPKFTLSSGKKGRVTVNIGAVSGATHYAVYLRASDGKKYKLIKTSKKLKFTVKKLTSGKKYYFKIKAYNTKNTSNYSSIFRIRKIKVK